MEKLHETRRKTNLRLNLWKRLDQECTTQRKTPYTPKIENRFRTVEEEIDTVHNTTSDLVTHTTRDEDLGAKISTEVEQAIGSTWENGGLRNVLLATMRESLSKEDFVGPLVEAFVANEKLRRNVSANVADLALRYVQANTQHLQAEIRANESALQINNARQEARIDELRKSIEDIRSGQNVRVNSQPIGARDGTPDHDDGSQPRQRDIWKRENS